MAINKSIHPDFWENFGIEQSDIEFLYNQLLELEVPQTQESLLDLIIQHRVKKLKEEQEKIRSESGGSIYFPKEHYEVGQKLSFPSRDWTNGEVSSIRPGFNPELEKFNVIDVLFENGEKISIACDLADHLLNVDVTDPEADPLLDHVHVKRLYGSEMLQVLEHNLTANPELVRIAGCWFPRALLVDVNNGHLNLIEAILEEKNGGPLTTRQLVEQVELKSSTNAQLIEFSLNYYLQEDARFDEVGPAGEVFWHLKSMEPGDVQKPPSFLQCEPLNYDNEPVKPYLAQFEGELFDELEEWEKEPSKGNEIKVSLIFPHWRSGTLPLSISLSRFFPTAYEAPRVCFTFVDQENKKQFPGWVIRPHKYVYGLKEWYSENGLMPGSLVHLQKGDRPGEIKVFREKSRQAREWLRTALIGSDQGIVFGMLKQSVQTTFNERMAFAIPDPEGFDDLWLKSSNRKEVASQLILKIMRELSKLNPQVHGQELYAAVNIVRRIPPGYIIHFLLTNPGIKHLGDLYFRISDEGGEE
jgi:hypothetical protein